MSLWNRLGPVKSLVRAGIPAALIAALAWPGASGGQREAAAGLLVGYWTFVYGRYRIGGQGGSKEERERLRNVSPDVFRRQYGERAPTIERPLSPYHHHRREMRTQITGGAVREHLRPGGSVLDIGCRDGLVADRILDTDATYFGLDFAAHRLGNAAKRFAGSLSTLKTEFVRGEAERMPFADTSVDVVVMGDVIEHLIRPELAVWEIARVLRPDGVFILTTKNASQVPHRSPLSHLFAWIEKTVGVDHPGLISRRRWIRPEPLVPGSLPDGSPPIFMPDTQHIMGETRRMLATAGLETLRWSTFEFPPPHSTTARWLEKRGSSGVRIVDVVERIARSMPLVRRMGTHLFMVARKTREPLGSTPPLGVWPGPFSREGFPGSVSFSRSTDAVAEV